MGKLVLIRHGQSVWNLKNVFTGWVDVPLSPKGIEEAIQAGKKLETIAFDMIFTSVQIRALETAMIAIVQNQKSKTPIVIHEDGKMKDWAKIYSQKMQEESIPVYQDWHLNERYYGELQGLNKDDTIKEYGEEQVHIWRRSYDVCPPKGECLEDTANRTIPFFEERILSQLKKGKNIMVSAHGNSLRSIVMFIEKLNQEEVLSLEIPTGQPIIYNFADDSLTRE
ncbi:MAG: 2,3-bisphosphoglycerate-dependent phosphoglycerate mutase [Bacteroidaceae bacterium]